MPCPRRSSASARRRFHCPGPGAARFRQYRYCRAVQAHAGELVCLLVRALPAGGGDAGQSGCPGLTIWGIAYEDDPDKLGAIPGPNGNPYQRLAADADGTTAINWGVYGVPETYFIDKTGIVRWRYAGALTDDVVASTLNPLLARYS